MGTQRGYRGTGTGGMGTRVNMGHSMGHGTQDSRGHENRGNGGTGGTEYVAAQGHRSRGHGETHRHSDTRTYTNKHWGLMSACMHMHTHLNTHAHTPERTCTHTDTMSHTCTCSEIASVGAGWSDTGGGMLKGQPPRGLQGCPSLPEAPGKPAFGLLLARHTRQGLAHQLGGKVSGGAQANTGSQLTFRVHLHRGEGFFACEAAVCFLEALLYHGLAVKTRER